VTEMHCWTSHVRHDGCVLCRTQRCDRPDPKHYHIFDKHLHGPIIFVVVFFCVREKPRCVFIVVGLLVVGREFKTRERNANIAGSNIICQSNARR
jgi:hypothetical protein